jgi:hypothetical protein
VTQVSRSEPQVSEAHKYRVIQWATGATGSHALRAIAEHPELELVGALVYSAEKAGRDVGELVGIGPIGVTATDDPDEILALDADCVVHMSQMALDPRPHLDDICRILESGKNVVTTVLTDLIYPKVMGAEVVQRLEAACKAGGVSFHGTGIEPGWASEVLPLVLSGLWKRVDCVTVREILDYATYPSRVTLFDLMGFGHPPERPCLIQLAIGAGKLFDAPLQMVADGLGVELEAIRGFFEPVLAPETYDIACGTIEKGTVAAMRFGLQGIIAGKPALVIEHVTRTRGDLAPEWPHGRGWSVDVEGEPSMRCTVQIATDGGDENDQGCLGTAMHAVNAIPLVCEAAPGIRTFLDLPMVLGRRSIRPR